MTQFKCQIFPVPLPLSEPQICSQNFEAEKDMGVPCPSSVTSTLRFEDSTWVPRTSANCRLRWFRRFHCMRAMAALWNPRFLCWSVYRWLPGKHLTTRVVWEAFNQVNWKNIKPPGGCNFSFLRHPNYTHLVAPWESHSFPVDLQLPKFGELQLVQIQDLVASNGFLQWPQS